MAYMARTKPNAVILGHSFVAGLADHLARTGQYSLYEHHCAEQLESSNKVHWVYLVGQSGAKAVAPPSEHCYRQYSLPERLLKNLRPEIAIIDLGTNDLAYGHTPLNTARAIMAIAVELRDIYQVPIVKINSLLPRDNLYLYSFDQFSQLVYDTNANLIHLCEMQPGISYHCHTGFWQMPDGALTHPSVWSYDAIHPNKPLGRKLYKSSLKTAIHDSVREFKRYNLPLSYMDHY